MARVSGRQLVKYIGYPAFFIGAFGFSLVWSFPIERFKSVAEQQLSQKLGRTVRIGELSLGMTGDVVLLNLEIEAPQEEATQEFPSSAEEIGEMLKSKSAVEPAAKITRPLSYVIEEAVLSFSVLGLLLGDLDAAIEMDALGGRVRAAYDGPLSAGKKKADPTLARQLPTAPLGKGNEASPQTEEPAEDAEPLSLSLELENIALVRVHELQKKLPLPITGEFSLSFEIESESGDMSDAKGELKLNLSNVVIGKAGAEIDVGGLPMTIEPIAVASLSSDTKIEKGEGSFVSFSTKSKDFDLKIQGTVSLRKPFERSQADIYVTFKILDGYRNRNDKTKMLVSNLEQFSEKLKRAKRSDGFFGFKYSGPLQGMKSLSRFIPSPQYEPSGRSTSERKPRPGIRDRRRGPHRAEVNRTADDGEERSPSSLGGGVPSPGATTLPSPMVMPTAPPPAPPPAPPEPLPVVAPPEQLPPEPTPAQEEPPPEPPPVQEEPPPEPPPVQEEPPSPEQPQDEAPAPDVLLEAPPQE